MALSGASNSFGVHLGTDKYFVILEVRGELSYTTGGSPLPTGLINGRFLGVTSARDQLQTISGRFYVWSNQDQVLRAFTGTTGLQVLTGTNCSVDRICLMGVIVKN